MEVCRQVVLVVLSLMYTSAQDLHHSPPDAKVNDEATGMKNTHASVEVATKTSDDEFLMVNKSLSQVDPIFEPCPASNVFQGMESGVLGYDLLEGDIYNNQVDPGFRGTIFKAYRKNPEGCFVSEEGITVAPKMSCSSIVSAYDYDSYTGFIEKSQSASSSSSEFQLGLEREVTAEIPDTGVSVGVTIPPTFTKGSENSDSSSNMNGFFESESGFGVTSHSECFLHHMRVSTLTAAPFSGSFRRGVGVLYSSTKMDKTTQRNVFLTFIRDYGTHYFTDLLFGAKVSITQTYSEYTTQKVGRTTLSECNTKKTSIMWFKKEQETKCKSSDESNIESNGGSDYSQIITTRGAAPPEEGGNWFDQDSAIPEPLKFQLAPIVNLFTDVIIDFENIITSDGPVNGKALRQVYAPLYFNYCGSRCVCFIQNCVTCSSEDRCATCRADHYTGDNGRTCTPCPTENCKQCSATGDSCETCQKGYHTFNDGLTCSRIYLELDGSLLLESTSGTAQNQGSFLGLYDLYNSNNGRPTYKQKEGLGYIWHDSYKGGTWFVGPTINGNSFNLEYLSTKSTPPTSGWTYYDGRTMKIDTTLSLKSATRATWENCMTVKVASSGGAGSRQSTRMGTYRWTGKWFNGRLVYESVKGGQYLKNPTNNSIWMIGPDSESGTGGVSSERSSICPCDPMASPSGWEYWYNNQWLLDRDMTVTCP